VKLAVVTQGHFPFILCYSIVFQATGDDDKCFHFLELCLNTNQNFRFLSPEVYENKCQVCYSYEWNGSVKLAE